MQECLLGLHFWAFNNELITLASPCKCPAHLACTVTVPAFVICLQVQLEALIFQIEFVELKVQSSRMLSVCKSYSKGNNNNKGKKKTKPFIAAKAWKETIAANSTQGRIDVLYPTKGKHRKIGKNNSKEKELRLCSLSPNCNWSAFSELCNKNLLSITCVHLKVWQVPMPW